MRARIPAAISASIAFSLALAPTPRTHACGGLFCSTTPVVQAGEEIVYALEDDGSLTMSVRLAYQGTDPDFAWLLPLPAPPELSLGTDELFTQLRASTMPLFVTTTRVEGTCRPEPYCVTRDGTPPYSTGCGMSSPPPSRATGWTGSYVEAGPRQDVGRIDEWDASARSDGGVDVFSQGSVGPYETVVLGAATATEVIEWLVANGYRVPSGSEATLEAYAATGHVFVALRLAADATASRIAPIVMHLPVEAPSLPLRLTAIATVPDLPITLWFLGRARVVPTNYSVWAIDETDARYWDQHGFYQTQVTRGIDALDGRAFASEYAGPTPQLQIALEPLADVAGLSSQVILTAIVERGYAADPAFVGIGARFGTVQRGLVTRYLRCLAAARDAADVDDCGEVVVDAGELAYVLDHEVGEPRRRAQAMIDSHPYLTRSFTTMSAAEMTIDPEFRADDALSDVAAVHTATVTTRCDSQHYAGDAPTVREIGGVETVISRGTIADDAAFCHERGLFLPSEVPPPKRSLCSCSMHGAPPGHWWALGVLAGIGFVRARLRSRRSLRGRDRRRRPSRSP